VVRLSNSVTEIGSFDSQRKSFALFLGPFRGPFFHQGLEWFLFVLFLTVLAFAHVSRSLYLGLIRCLENNASPIDLCRRTHLHHRITTTVFLDFPPTAIAMRIIFTASLTSCLGISYRWEGPVKIKEFQTD
jgi:hypothetical protein